jgi:hypothetical protein
MELPFTGVCVVGKFAGVEPVRHRAEHPTRAGEPVAGMFRLLVSVSEYEGDWPISCGYFVTDRFSHEPTRASTDLQELGLSQGERIICRVTTRAAGKYVNYDLLSVARIDGGPDKAEPGAS